MLGVNDFNDWVLDEELQLVAPTFSVFLFIPKNPIKLPSGSKDTHVKQDRVVNSSGDATSRDVSIKIRYRHTYIHTHTLTKRLTE